MKNWPQAILLQSRLTCWSDVTTLNTVATATAVGTGRTKASIGTAITDPNIDYATLAKAYGMYGSGPIENPNDLGPAIRKAIEVVKRGEPALVDVVTQPR